MLKHYFKVAFRNLWKHKTFSILNITGLALGMAAAMVLALWIADQLSVDAFHEKKDRIFKVFTNRKASGQITTYPVIPAPLARQLQPGFSEIKQVCRIREKNNTIRYEDKVLNVQGNIVDASFLDMFSFPILTGSNRSFENTKAIFISEKLAFALFGNAPAIGMTIEMDSAQPFVVKAVFKDLPTNTQFRFDYLLPWAALPFDNTSWQNNVASFVELYPNSQIASLNGKANRYVATQEPQTNEETSIFFYPLERTWLYGRFENGKPAGGIIDLVKILEWICLIIVMIACINFMNLSTARSLKRLKEIGLRKLVGGKRRSLVGQFLGEAIFLCFFAGIMAIAIAGFVLPWFNLLTTRHITIPYGSYYFWLSFLLFILITGLIAGSYPAWYLSSFNPRNALKGILEKKNGLIAPRKILFVFQFVIAIVLINLTILLERQMDHLKTRPAGFNTENLVFQVLTPSLIRNYPIVKNELYSLRCVNAVSVSNVPITRNGERTDEVTWPGKTGTDKTEFDIRTTAGNFITTNGLALVQGRDIDLVQFPADTNVCLINEAAAAVIRYEHAIGQKIKRGNNSWTIVGVVADFITTSPLQAADPVIIRGSTDNNFITIKLNPGQSFPESINEINAVLKKNNSNFVTELQYADADYDQKIRGLRLTTTLTKLFAFIAILISCLGLFGLVMYVTETRTKEVSIRKVFGAGVFQLTTMLSRSFMLLVALSFLIASPLAWLLMNAFLRPFYFRTPINIFMLFEAGAIALIITAITICTQTVKIGLTNPIKNLKNE